MKTVFIVLILYEKYSIGPMRSLLFIGYGKCSKILNTSCLAKRPVRANRADSGQTAKRPRQTGQTQSRQLLKKQSDQCLQ